MDLGFRADRLGGSEGMETKWDLVHHLGFRVGR